MIPFKKITQGEKITIASFMADINKEEKPVNYEQWLNDADSFYAIVEGRLVFRRQQEHTYYHSMPYGNGPLRYVLMQVLEASTIMGCKCVVTGIVGSEKADVNAAMPGHFSFTEEADGTVTATALQNFSNSVFNNNESMVSSGS